MTRTLMKQDFFLAWSICLVTNVVGFYLNVLDLYFGDFEIHHCPIEENGKIVQLLGQMLQREATYYLWRGVVSGGHCSHS